MNSFLKALTTNPFSQIWFILRIQSFWTFFNMTHRIGSKNEHFFSTWLKENVSFFSLTQRIFLFDTMYDSKNKLIVFGKYDSKNWTFFFNLTLRIEPSFLNMTQRIEPFSQSDSKNCFFFFFSQLIRRLDFSFSNMSDRNNFFFCWKKDDSKNWFSENINQIIQTLFWWLKELSFFFFLKRHDS